MKLSGIPTAISGMAPLAIRARLRRVAAHVVKPMTQLGPKLTLADTSRTGPALLYFHSQIFDHAWLFMAWSGVDNDFINFMQVDEFAGRINKTTSVETALGSPSLTAHGENIIVAWTGTGNPNQLNVGPGNWGIAQGNTDFVPLRFFDQNKVTLGETSAAGPALTSHRDRLFISWTSKDNNLINLMVSEDGGVQFLGKVTLSEAAIGRPFIVSHHERLVLAWTGLDHRLNIAEVVIVERKPRPGSLSHPRIAGLKNKITLADTSNHGPVLGSFGDRLSLAWTAADDRSLNFLFSVDNGASFHGKFTSSEKALEAPILSAGGGRLYVAWTGVDAEGHLNLALYRSVTLRYAN